MESSTIPYKSLEKLKKLHDKIPYLKSELARQEGLHSSQSRHVGQLKILTCYTLPQQFALLKELAHKIDQINDTVKDIKSKRTIHDSLMEEVSQQQDNLTKLLVEWDASFRAVKASNFIEVAPSYMDPLSTTSSIAIKAFISCVISSSTSSSLAQSLMQRQGSDLLRLPTALRPCLILLVESRGVLVCADFMEAMLGTAVDELEALELAKAHTSRQRELESVVIGLCELCDGLKLDVPVKAPPAKAGFLPSRGPFHLGLEFQQVLLELLDEGRKIRAFVKSSAASQAEGEKSSRSSQDTPSFWHETGSTIMGISNSIISTPGNLIASTFNSRHTHTQQSSIDIPQQSKEMKAKYDLLHTRSAVALLQALTPAETEQQISLPLYLIRRLLQSRFPSDARPTAHRRALLLLVVRYYGFTYLSYILSRLGSGDILDGVHISRQDSTDLILPLHRRAYMALIDSTGFTADGVENRFVKELLSDPGGPNQTSFVNGLRTLRIASRGFLSSFLAPVQPVEPGHASQERSFVLHKNDLLDIWDTIGASVSLSATANASSPSSATYTPFSRPPFSFKTRTTSTESVPRTQQPSPQPETQPTSADLYSQISDAMAEIKAMRKSESADFDWTLFFSTTRSQSSRSRVSRISQVGYIEDPPVSPNTSTNPSEDPFVATTDQTPVQKASQASIISWGRKQKPSSTPIPPKPAGGIKDAESVLLSRALKYCFSCLNANCRLDDDLSSFLSRMLALAKDRQHFTEVSILSQACQKLSSFAQDRPQLLSDGASAVLKVVLSPLEAEEKYMKQTTDAFASALATLRSTCSRLVPAARQWLSLLDNVRVRIYYLDRQIDNYAPLAEIVDRINNGSRSEEERKSDFHRFRQWLDANQVHEFMPLSASAADEAETEFAELLMHVDRVTGKMSDVEELAAFFTREAAQLRTFERNLSRSERNAPSPSNSPNPMTYVLANSSQMIDRFGKMLPQKDAPRTEGNLDGPFTFLESGAMPSAFVQQDDSCSSPLSAIDSWILRVQLRLSGYLASHLHSDSRFLFDALGSDAWFESYSAPKKGLSPSLQSIDALTSTFLRRFTLHPNPVSKNAALGDLEQVLVAALLMEKSGVQVGSEATGYFRRMSVSLTRRTSYLKSEGPTSPTRKGRHSLPGQSDASAEGWTTPATTPGLQSSVDMPFPKQEVRTPSVMEPPSTDMLLNNLEPIILSVRPHHLFAALQYSAILIPSSVLDMRDDAKAYWDLALAALSAKEDFVREMVSTSVDLLPRGLDQEREAARRLLTIAAREGNEQAKELLPSLLQ